MGVLGLGDGGKYFLFMFWVRDGRFIAPSVCGEDFLPVEPLGVSLNVGTRMGRKWSPGLYGCINTTRDHS